jgi:hypothetical protein
MTVTTDTLDISEEYNLGGVWRQDIPQLAFEHDYLLNNVLAAASMHLCQLRPESADYKTAGALMNKALRSFRNAILNISPDNFVAPLANAALMSPVSLVANRVSGHSLSIVDWMRLHRGAGVLLNMVPRDLVMQSSIAPIYRIAVQKGPPDPICIPFILQQLCDLIEEDIESAGYRDIVHKCLVELGKLYGGLALHRGELSYHVKVLRWPYDMPEQFIDLAKQHRPHILVILAHYVLFFEFLELWWSSGIAEKEIGTIANILSEEWQRFIRVPQLAVKLHDKKEMAELMLSQLPVEEITESLLPPGSIVGSQPEFASNKSNMLDPMAPYQAESPNIG